MSSEPKQITVLKQLNGKTIAKAAELCHGDKTGLAFDDGSFAVFSMPISPHAASNWDLYYMGLISDIERKRRETESSARAEAQREERDRREYERLKAKFEGPQSA